MPRLLSSALLVALTATLVVRAQGTSSQTPSESADDIRFHSSADLVVLHVSVRDRGGRDIDNLPERAFAVFEDGSAQPITLFTNEDAPVTVGLVIDGSVSMVGIREQVIGAATSFAAASHPRDDMFALAFNEEVRAVLPAGEPFTSDSNVLRRALMTGISARGRTALFDAVTDGLDYVARGRYERRMLVVISDGDDNASRTSLNDLVSRVQSSNAVIFTVALHDQYGSGGNTRVMRTLAEASGGQAFTPKSMSEVSDALTLIAHELRHSYTVGYAAPRPEASGYRRVRVAVAAPSGRRVTVRTRTGYRVSEQRSSDVIR